VATTKQRAKRYAVALPVRYRLAASGACYAGWTENMSVSGLLFTAATALPVGTSVEAWVEMSRGSNGGNASMLYCVGLVVRQVMSNDSRPAAAMRIARCRVLPFTPDFASAQFGVRCEERL